MSEKRMILVAVLLVALGVGIVVYMNSGKPALKPSSNSAIGLNGSTLGGLFALAGKAFSSGKSPASSMGDDAISAPLSTSGAATAADLSKEGFNTSNYTTSNGFEFTDSSGNFVAG